MISECFYCEKPLTDPHASFCERCGEKIKENEK
jgi:predicted amidophosphoribosyltransferase